MTYETLISIFETTPKLGYDQRPFFAFREGMMILFDLFEESDEIAAEHDQLWYGDPAEVLDKITPEQCIRLAELGWFIDEESFSFFT